MRQVCLGGCGGILVDSFKDGWKGGAVAVGELTSALNNLNI